jgi:FtsP/CotA-like multicopper oxidase with cupredoxin domain
MGHVRYCYVTEDSSQSPTLRVRPGDLLILNLTNDLHESKGANPGQSHHGVSSAADPCSSGQMTALSTNFHFHGLSIPPVCHQDEVLKTSIPPGRRPFEFKVRIPKDQPPGLYWYHPHIHGFSKIQVLRGASGAIVVEGIEQTNKDLEGMRERVLVIRDQDLINPNAPVPVAPKVQLDRDGDVVNTGTGGGKPAKDLSINFVPVSYPDYQPAIITMKPGERQLWRVVNACAITYLDLRVIFNREPQMLKVVAFDGVPINRNGNPNMVVIRGRLLVPPAGRVEFIVSAPPEGTPAALITRSVNTGPGGENDPKRSLASIVVSKDEPQATRLPANLPKLVPPPLPWLGDVVPVRTRKLYFSEKLQNPSDPTSATSFYITVDGHKPTTFDPMSNVPDIVVKQGDVEDWIIEDRSNELHAFHIYQIHFLHTQSFGIPVNDPFLRDTIDVPFCDGKGGAYPSVTLRMDFRDPNIVGSFPYHCHLLEHEDNGMMGLIRVEPR